MAWSGVRLGSSTGSAMAMTLVAAGAEAGVVWSEEEIVTYVQDPRGYLRETLDEPPRAQPDGVSGAL